ncbi:MAG: hypothetical protein WAU91_04445 [Desulfatitalea sp.]
MAFEKQLAELGAQYIARVLEICFNRRTHGIGEHRLANWPTQYLAACSKERFEPPVLPRR